ncbi:helix-turn-helix domain-containing protein [Moritella sp. F3]|uniref:helix-turn-helix domain-containing protein n=1 Tax=Moritella sp. F3 TaxID=2718882 RepID=UPI0018E12AAA|nr:helix-turn-helix domain-containing protein [Moritella sp. F3]GIC77157.1 hypothetical protein FMO001_18840 [Moritella sp. F1]GIC82276.1 hypothetical protein FMO003_25570 [Moritella sp. F3]
MIEEHSKTKTSYYRRLLVAYLIDGGVNTPSLLENVTGMPKRTLQAVIKALGDLDIECVDSGGTTNKSYSIDSWGAIEKNWIENHLQHITDVLRLSHVKVTDLIKGQKMLGQKHTNLHVIVSNDGLTPLATISRENFVEASLIGEDIVVVLCHLETPYSTTYQNFTYRAKYFPQNKHLKKCLNWTCIH